MDAKTTYISTDRFSEIKNQFQNYLFDIVRVIFLHTCTCLEHIPKLSQQCPKSVKISVSPA